MLDDVDSGDADHDDVVGIHAGIHTYMHTNMHLRKMFRPIASGTYKTLP